MTPEQKAAYVIAQAVEAFGQFAGMMAENTEAIDNGKPPPHRPPDFEKVVLDKGLHHNALITFFHHDY